MVLRPKRFIHATAGFSACILIWQIAAVRTSHSMIIPYPVAVFGVLLHPQRDLLATGSWSSHLLASAARVAVGFLIALATAVPLGILAGRIRRLHSTIGPVVEFLLPVSPLAWTPFTLIIFKTDTLASLFGNPFHYGLTGQIQLGMLAIVFYSSFFPVYINTAAGVRNIPEQYHQTAKVNGCSTFQTFFIVDIPATLPAIFSGVKIGFGMAWRAIIGAEMLPGTTAGLGFLLVYAYQLAEMQILGASLVLIGLTGALGNVLITVLGTPIRRWHGEKNR